MKKITASDEEVLIEIVHRKSLRSISLKIIIIIVYLVFSPMGLE